VNYYCLPICILMVNIINIIRIVKFFCKHNKCRIDYYVTVNILITDMISTTSCNNLDNTSSKISCVDSNFHRYISF
jgi:hypothetical protein